MPRGPRFARLTTPRLALLLLVLGLALTPAIARAFEVHLVQPGETLSAIAVRYGKSISEIADQNGIQNPNLIFAGQTLQITHPDTTAVVRYVVQPGDSLSGIAQQHGVTIQSIVQANGIGDPDHIVIGRVLEVPTSGTSGAPVSSATAEAALRDAEIEFGLPTGILRGLAWQESGWQQHVVSPAGAVGLTQLLPSTAEWVVEFLLGERLNWYFSAQDNARVGASFLRYLIDRADGDVWWALAAYYQGWGSIERFGAFEDTRQYVENVLSLAEEYD